MPTAKPLKKRIEDILETVIAAQFVTDGLTCARVKSHSQIDKPALPYLLIICDAVPNNEEFPTTAGVKVASISLAMVSNVNEDTESEIDACLQSAICAMEDTVAMQTEVAANYPDIFIHVFRYADSGTDRDDETVQYDVVEFMGDLEYISVP